MIEQLQDLYVLLRGNTEVSQAWITTALMLAGKMYGASQAGKSASNSQQEAYDKAIAENELAFRRAVEQGLLSTGGYGFTNLANYLYRGEYAPGFLNKMTDQQLLQVAERYGVEPTYRTEYTTKVKKRGGIAGLFGGTKLRKKAVQTLNRDELIAKLEPVAVKPFEKEMGRDLMATYDQGLTPEEGLQTFRGIQERFQPTVDAAGDQARGLFSGQRLQEQLSELKPIEEAERQRIAGIADAYDTQTAQELNALKARNLSKYGSANEGLGAMKLGAQMRLAANESLANLRGDMNVGQAERRAAVQEADRQAKFSNLGLGATMAQQAGQFATLPSDMAGEYQRRRADWMAPAKISGVPTATYSPFTQFKPVASSGQIQSGLMTKIFDQMYKAGGGMDTIGKGIGIG